MPGILRMLNYIWGGMILIGILYAAFHGTMPAVGEAALSSAREAVNLCITMLGVMGLWLGMMEVARASGIMERLNRLLKPVLRFLFPNIPQEHPSMESIGVNLIANILGLGWAATPAGLKAMEELAELEEERSGEGTEEKQQSHLSISEKKEKSKNDFQKEKSVIDRKVLRKNEETVHKKSAANDRERKQSVFGRVASNEMCTFLVLNISSLQLIPVNVIAYRAQYGSASPTAVIGPGLVATLFSTIVAVVFCKLMNRKRKING